LKNGQLDELLAKVSEL